MNASELRAKYLEFFEHHGHLRVPSGSLVPYDVTGRLDESLLFNGAGMVQFKPYFRGVAQPPGPRLTNSQKCLRTGDIEEVGDASHLTFFEMLGNFSFGDYFKAGAIAYSWEFLTDSAWLGLDPSRLCFTVFEADDEAFDHWADRVRSVGLRPEQRIFRLGEATNYWPAGAFTHGPPGPCGPNSEMFYWLPKEEPAPTGDYSVADFQRDEAAGKWLEVWNDVFIQSEWQGELKNPARPADGYRKTGMPDLPFQSVDTGMGLERTAAALAGFDNVYAIDVFQPIFAKLQQLGDRRYGESREVTAAMRVVADHLRAASFCIADGVLPSNTGRGYVLRRLIRRAALKGIRVLEFDKEFLADAFDAVREAMASAYPELDERRSVVAETLDQEETQFRRTLAGGEAMLVARLTELKPGETLSGHDAFRLYDTFGFPLEVTQELCREQGREVDLEEFELAMAAAQERSRAAGGQESVYGGVSGFDGWGEDDGQPTAFVGYGALEATSTVKRTGHGSNARRLRVITAETPFYVASGGQESDTGHADFSLPDGSELRSLVVGLSKVGGQVVHEIEFESEAPSPEHLLGAAVHLQVDQGRRDRLRRHHTATHLLHAALRKVLGTHVTQAGSLVAEDGLRFDFTHGKAVSEFELKEIEDLVNAEALRGTEVVTYVDLPIEEARARGAMALFGEKYGDRVRMVEINGFSRELCGGTHVARTSEVGLVKLVREGSAASGVRRIEAVAGEAALAWAREQSERVREAAGVLKSTPEDLVPAARRALEVQKDLAKKLEKARHSGASSGAGQAHQIGSIELLTSVIRDGEPADAAAFVDNAVANHPGRVAVAVAIQPERAMWAVKCGHEAVAAGAHAGNLVRALAQMTGGGGGGRPDFATAGGKQPEKVQEAMDALAELLSAQVKSS
ncbi:MAG: alanine--tRNA ligase [Fimbriimonadaceae bacterium]